MFLAARTSPHPLSSSENNEMKNQFSLNTNALPQQFRRRGFNPLQRSRSQLLQCQHACHRNDESSRFQGVVVPDFVDGTHASVSQQREIFHLPPLLQNPIQQIKVCKQNVNITLSIGTEIQLFSNKQSNTNTTFAL